MDRLSSFVFVVLIFYIVQCFGETSNQVKITSTKTNYVNYDYINKTTFSGSLKKVNSTYTSFPIRWDVIKDFPLDTIFTTTLLRSRTKNGKYEIYNTYVSYICDTNDRYHKYLPNFLIQLTASGNCIRKGKHKFKDAGQFQFYKFLPKKEVNGYYFDTYNQIKSYKLLIKDIEIKSKSIHAL